ncbi:MAG: DUF4956 domain-containing protein [Longimicrobiales bacterium]
MSASARSSIVVRRMIRILVFYGVLGVVGYLLVRYVPWAAEAFSGDRLQELGAASDPLFGPGSPPPVGQAVGGGGSTALLGAASMLGALAVMVPVTWIYMLTRQRRGYDESVVHTLLILPVAVTGIVMIVQNSLALAFSLAGIVAAVRFRTTLDDTKDAVYVFLAIGVGLACGVQAVGLALVLSLIFNAVILVLWFTRFGNLYQGIGTGPGGLTLGDALAGPTSGLTARHVGDAALLDAASPRDLKEVADRAVRMERHISEERGKKSRKRANTLVLVHARDARLAQEQADPVFEELATRWKLAEITQGGGGHVVLEYLARLDGAGVEGALLERLRDVDGVAAAELRSLKGLKPRS